MEHILKTYNLTRTYKNINVVDNLNMTVNKGEIYGFLGQNGAGKTTTLKMIMGLINISKGEFELFGQSHFSRDVYGRVGSIVEAPGFYPNLTAEENLEVHRRMMGIENKEYIKEALDIVGLDPKEIEKKIVKKFSLGMKQRLALARAILHKPEFLILDEPTNGLDPIGIKSIRETLIDLCKKREITILMSSHILGEIQQLASKIGIIHKGKLLEEIEYKEIEKKNRHYLNIRVNDDKKASVVLEKELNIFDYKISEESTIRVYEKLNKTSDISKALINNDVNVEELSVKVDTLEDYFVKLTGGNING